MRFFFLFKLPLLFISSSLPMMKTDASEYHLFIGRDEMVSTVEMIRRPVYRAKIPKEWTVIETEGSIIDTRKPNATCVIEKKLILSIHTFPSKSLEERIPPQAQVQRWKTQHGDAVIKEVGHGGFAGLFMENETILAWSMQLDFDHYQKLSFLASSREEEEYFKQMRADYTIKAVGPAELIKKHRDEIILFAQSFELIYDLPLSW